MRAPVAVVVGTRPEAIKMAPVVRVLGRSRHLAPLLVSTGQHRQMLDQALAAFSLVPDIDLGVMAARQTLADTTARILEGMRRILDERRPAWVLVQGDTTTALAGAMAAFYAHIPVGHVEAGLRTDDRNAPFPEEMNRRVVDQLADLYFAPTASAGRRLRTEGVTPGSVHVTGNTVVDALLATREAVRADGRAVHGVPKALLQGRRLVLVTVHRRESFGEGLRSICAAVRRLVNDTPDVCVALPVHLNPLVEGPVRQFLGAHPRIALLPPLSYLDFVALLDRAHLVLTDSGGVQEEAPTFGKPILVMRDVTERPEGLAAGVAKLVGTDEDRIYAEAATLLRDETAWRRMAGGGNPYGDGLAAQRIVTLLERRVPATNARAAV